MTESMGGILFLILFATFPVTILLRIVYDMWLRRLIKFFDRL